MGYDNLWNPEKGMSYGILQRYGLSLQTKSVDAKSHGLLQVMGYQRDGLWQSQL